MFVPGVLVLESLACQSQSAVSDKLDDIYSVSICESGYRIIFPTKLLASSVLNACMVFVKEKIILTTDITQVFPLIAVNNLVNAEL